MALSLDGIDRVLVHPDSDATALVDTIRAAITPAEATALESTINSNKGNWINPQTIIPASVVANQYTYAEMTADGWFPEPPGA